MAAPIDLQVQGLVNPSNLVYHTLIHKYQWCPPTGVTQTAYQIQVNTQANFLGTTLWDSGKVTSPHSYVFHSGTTPTINTTYYWQIRVWDGIDVPTDYSSSQHFRISRYASAWTKKSEFLAGTVVNVVIEGAEDDSLLRLKGPPYISGGLWTSEVRALGPLYKIVYARFYEENVAGKTNIIFQIRVGNTPTPDGTWTSWLPMLWLDSDGNPGIESTLFTYFQIRVRLDTIDPSVTPRLR